jgi:phospholipase/lecithinase/hemolysin
MPTVISLKSQVDTLFKEAYSPTSLKPASPPASWTSADSIFAFWIGINDVGNSYYKGVNETGPLNAKIFDVYSGLVDMLFDAGARNFVFLNVPPVDRSPLTIGQGNESQAMEKSDILAFNGLIEDMAADLKGKQPDTNVWVYDTYTVFGEVLDDPATYPQTSGYKNTTGYCEGYQK